MEFSKVIKLGYYKIEFINKLKINGHCGRKDEY